MIAVLLGAFVILAISVGVLLLVALPHIRHGSRILTPRGERAVRRARAKSSTAAAGAGRAATAVPAKIIEPLRGPKVKPARVPRSRRRLPPSRGGPGPLVVRPDDTGGLRLTRDVVGPVDAEPAVADSDVVVASASWGGETPRHVSGGVAYPAPKRPLLPDQAEAVPVEPANPGNSAHSVNSVGPVEPEPVHPQPAAEDAREPEPEPEPAPPARVVAKPLPKPLPEPAPGPGPTAVGRQRPSPAESGPIQADSPADSPAAPATDPGADSGADPATDPAVSKPPIKPAAKGASKPRSKSTRGAPRGRSAGRGTRHPRQAPETRPVEVVDVRTDEATEAPAPSDAANRASS